MESPASSCRTTSTTRRSVPQRCSSRMEAGSWFALVSDAGMPAISDPGARLVAAALERGVPVTVLPGPTAVDTALVASGFPAERYQFVGFLPRGARALASLWEELASWPHPVVAFESPRRLPATLRSLADAEPAREVAVCRELTKKFEEVVRGTAAELAARFAEAPKGGSRSCSGPGARARTSVQRSRQSVSSSPPGCRAGKRQTSCSFDGRVAQRALPPYFVASIDNRDRPLLWSLRSQNWQQGGIRAASCCLARVRVRAPGVGGARVDLAGRRTGSCGLSRSIMRIPTRAVSTAASISAPRAVRTGARSCRGNRLVRGNRADGREDRVDRDAARGTPPHSFTSARSV